MWRLRGVLARVRPHPPGQPDRARVHLTPYQRRRPRPPGAGRPVGDPRTQRPSVTNSADEVEIQTERNEPFQARLDLSPACAGSSSPSPTACWTSSPRSARTVTAAPSRRSLAHRQRNRQMWEV